MRNKWRIATIILIVVLLLFIVLASFTLQKTKIHRDYYKDQMINFCQATKVAINMTIQADPTAADLANVFPEDCSYWILPGDSNE